MVKNRKYRMTKYVLALNKHPFSLNLRSSLINMYDFSVLVILKKQTNENKVK